MSLIICRFVSCCPWLHRDSSQAQGGGCSHPTDCCRHWNGFHQISGRTHILLASLNWLWLNALAQLGTRAKNIQAWKVRTWSAVYKRGLSLDCSIDLVLSIFAVLKQYFSFYFAFFCLDLSNVAWQLHLSLWGYDLNVKNLVNVNYSTNATCDSAM